LAASAAVPILLVVAAIVGPNTGKVSDKFGLFVTPPAPFFAIWGVIYLGLIVAGIYSVAINVWSLGVTVLFGVVSILNALWIYVFDYASVKSNNICLVLLISMVVLNEVQWIWMEIPGRASGNILLWNIVNRNIFAFYQGWLVAASNLNIGITLVYSFGISKRTQAYIFWILCPTCIIFMMLLNLSHPNGFENNIAMYFSASYALVGAFISTKKMYSSSEGNNLSI
jgi:hypothetical protein